MTLPVSGLPVANCRHHNGHMADQPEPSWHRLGEHVIARRLALGYRTREPLAQASGISTRILGDIETGRRDGRFDPKTIAALENTLGWTTGSALRIAAGGEPDIRTRAATRDPVPLAGGRTAAEVRAQHDEALRRVMYSDRLSDSQKEKIMKVLIAEKEAAERQRVEHAEQLIEMLADDR